MKSVRGVPLLLPITLALVACSSLGDESSALSEFREIAINSCDLARSDGVLEHTEDFSYRAVMVPKESGIDGYSAAWMDQTGHYSLIYETDFFMSCAYANTFTLYEEASMEPTMQVTKDGKSFLVSDPENPRNKAMKFQVKNGLLVSASNEELTNSTVIFIDYAPPLENSLEIIEKALSQESNN